MEWCKPHWDRLKEAINARGLDHLVSKTGQEALDKTIQEVEQGNQTKETFDPLMAAFWAINNAELRFAGLAAIGRCPLCNVEADTDGNGKVRAQGWIDGASTDAFNAAKHYGLITDN